MATVSVSDDTIFRLHPSAIRINASLVVQSCGPTARAFAPSIMAGGQLCDFFEIQPRLKISNLDDIAAREVPLTLVSKDRGIHFRGTVLPTSEGYLVAARPLISTTEVTSKGIEVSDFPADDPSVQYMMQIAFLKNLRDEAEQTAISLKIARAEIGDILCKSRQVTGFIAHEFNNLLSIIRLNCDRITSSGIARKDIAPAIALVREAAVRGGSVSQSLRALAGKTDLYHREILDDFLRSNWTLLRSLCGPDVTVSCKLEAGSACIDAPLHCLLNCLISLLHAAGLAHQGNVHVHISTRVHPPPFAGESLADEHPMAELGIRIETVLELNGPDLLSRRFRSFFRQDYRETSLEEFAKSAGGTIVYEPCGPHSGIITIGLPLAEDPPPPSPEYLSESEYAKVGRSARTLRHLVVVEDEPAALEAMVELLEFEGFEVAACANAEEALSALEARPDALLVTDVVLPTMDGLSLAQEATRAYPEVKVIIMSGHIPDSGACHQDWTFLQKPLNVDDLVDAICRAGNR